MSGHFTSLLGEAPASSDRIPVTVLTGFLGSGKTTLISRLLRLSDLSGTAVIVNEFGEIGIDHDLIAHTSEDTVLLSNGCLCCSVRGDLIEALFRLAERGNASGQPVQRVLIETSGLAHPAPILHTLMGEPGIRARYALAGVACTVDAVLAMGTLDRYPEAIKQAAVADHLFLTKTDLLAADAVQPLRERLQAIAANAAIHTESHSYPVLLRALVQSPPGGDAAFSAVRPTARDSLFFSTMGGTGAQAVGPVPHRDGITSFVLVRDEPLPRDGFFAWLDMVTAMRGDDLLRVKGIVNLAEQLERPLVIHGVQHLFHPPQSLPAWPGADRRTRIVFITRGIDAQAMDETLDVFTRRRARAGGKTSPSANLPRKSETT